ncbi:antibiotic biosynthesis monooxygenase [Rhodobacteraceae bacterium HSP-20]|uniref:Antibiotic biosynthesis monooxygenase n=1 Tax=Paragemmobacter amnigenus TaxID=2852097 RepID=A0ABS6IZW3_9RHOB|nr:antibiotic biosynthesis monooxygenase [Rhodobacter amnigenus]MBU9697039.1 antibiotic biosynthesis monooxygenase [Rhodobacter amnigenus]MBV4388266.1 antibiotic biosynthesis monooxygenase [Rhodobacter amnigenus]
MHALFFDMQPKAGHMPHYFEHVDRLRPLLAAHEGLLYLERFRPLDRPDAILSHQHWAGEVAIRAWRCDGTHRASQAAGRKVHFESYRIRVGPEVVPEGAGRFVVAAYGDGPAGPGRVHESVTRAGRFLTLAEAGQGEVAREIAARARAEGAEDVRIFAVSRDYGMTDRAEAPSL